MFIRNKIKKKTTQKYYNDNRNIDKRNAFRARVVYIVNTFL